jgi:pilus assembly protein Flp/PilA
MLRGVVNHFKGLDEAGRIAYARLLRDERGATAVEYGLMVALIAGAIIITVTALGGQLNTLFTTISTALGTAS